uniref:Uncharacterized protein n=1 Tax=Romanomermis culicivorax TaxID=13658 RepID=A0A915L683_ROMCU
MFVAGLVLAVLDFRNFHISLHLLLISLLSFVVMVVCLLFHKKRRPPSNAARNVVDGDDEFTFFKIFKICSRRRDENSWQTTIAERSKKKTSCRNHCRLCRTSNLGSSDVEERGDRRRRQLLKTKVAVNPAHSNRCLKILNRNYTNYEGDLSPTTVRRKIANTKSLSSPLRRKSNGLVDMNVAENCSLIISQENGAFETLQELISLHSQASLLSGGSFPLHERFGPGLVSP